MSKPQRTYYYRGQVERWVPSKRTYMWRDAYSDNNQGNVTYPWSTMRECQAEARKLNKKAIFVR